MSGRARTARGRAASTRAPGPAEGTVVRLVIGPVAHGGHCVARHEGRVVFVRHALPGELADVRLTEAGERDRFWRGDAVAVVEPSPERVEPRCDLARPGGCGGCDWQHASLEFQRRSKADVVTEQLRRIGRTPVEGPLEGLVVEAVPGDVDGLGWRTRMRFAVDDAGRAGLRRHRSHDVVPIDACPIADPEVDAVGVPTRAWPGTVAVEVVAARAGGEVERLVVLEPARSGAGRRRLPVLDAPASLAVRGPDGVERLSGRGWVREEVLVDGVPRTFRVSGAGFWQVHPGAAKALLDAVLGAADARPGEHALDLYCGVGLFAAGLASRVGREGSVLGVEGEGRAVADARRNLHDLPWVRLEHAAVASALAAPARPDRADVVVLDPPRTGAGREVVEAIAALRPRVVVYVACDPAALARDVAIAADAGYRLAGLRAFDLFPMTHHMECVATLVPTGPSPR